MGKYQVVITGGTTYAGRTVLGPCDSRDTAARLAMAWLGQRFPWPVGDVSIEAVDDEEEEDDEEEDNGV